MQLSLVSVALTSVDVVIIVITGQPESPESFSFSVLSSSSHAVSSLCSYIEDGWPGKQPRPLKTDNLAEVIKCERHILSKSRYLAGL